LTLSNSLKLIKIDRNVIILQDSMYKYNFNISAGVGFIISIKLNNFSSAFVREEYLMRMVCF